MTYLCSTAVFNARNKSLFVSSFFIACTIPRCFQCLNRFFRRFVLNPGASYRHTAVVHNQRLKYTSLTFLKLNVCLASEKNYFLAIINSRNAYPRWFFEKDTAADKRKIQNWCTMDFISFSTKNFFITLITVILRYTLYWYITEYLETSTFKHFLCHCPFDIYAVQVSITSKWCWRRVSCCCA